MKINKKIMKSTAINLVFCIFCLIVLSTIYTNAVCQAVGVYNNITIVVDAGHGGRDGGCVGINGSVEKELNLAYANEIKKGLISLGYRVIMTRTNDDGLYSNLVKNKKIDDMNKRLEIIKKANPNLVLSVHMNSFSDTSARGAVTYHKIDDSASETCADLIQNCLSNEVDAKIKNSKPGDYFMLNCSYYTSVLIECGFISNPEEEKLLATEKYRKKIANAICNGIYLYFGN